MGKGPERRPARELDISMHTAACHLESSFAPFMEFAFSYLKGLVDDSVGRPVVKSRLFWNASPRRNWKDSGYRRGRRIFQDSSGAGTARLLLAEILELPGLQIELGWQDNILLVDAYYFPTSRMARTVGRFNPFLPRVYVILIYYLVYFPLVYSLYLSRGWHLLHAGGVEYNRSGTVFAGLPGSGKSTFILSLLSQPGIKLLSDNLLLFDSRRVFACPEPLHLSKESIKVVDRRILERLDDTQRKFSHQRQDYRLEDEGRAWGTTPQTLIFLGLAVRREHKRLAEGLALERLTGYDRMAKEINAYEQFAASLDLLVSDQESEPTGRISGKKEALAALISQMDCWELWVEKGEDLSQSWKWLEELYEGKEPYNELQQRFGAGR